MTVATTTTTHDWGSQGNQMSYSEASSDVTGSSGRGGGGGSGGGTQNNQQPSGGANNGNTAIGTTTTFTPNQANNLFNNGSGVNTGSAFSQTTVR
jgi:hypothetical protein